MPNYSSSEPSRKNPVPERIPRIEGKPILGTTPSPAFRVAAREIIDSIIQQFPDRTLAFRELGQNSADAGASRILLRLEYSDKMLIADFIDNGCGMTREVIERNYLTLFDSSKEDRADTIGYYSLGRISAFAYPLHSLEILTLAKGDPIGYRLVIGGDFSGTFRTANTSSVEEVIGHPHGTRIRLCIPVTGWDDFEKETEAIANTVTRELRWLHPEVMIERSVAREDGIAVARETINEPFAVPGRLSQTTEVKLASGLGEAEIAIGLEGESFSNPREPSSGPEAGLAPITLAIGRIPVQRTTGIPWTNQDPINLQKLRIAINSFQFRTNIGRNRIYLDEPFVRELLPKIFEKLILGRYVPFLINILTHKLVRPEVLISIQGFLTDICAQSRIQGFPLPEGILTAPIIPGRFGGIVYSVGDLDQHKGQSIYYSWEKPLPHGRFESPAEKEKTDTICISLAFISFRFREWLTARYGDRVVYLSGDCAPANEQSTFMLALTRRVEDSLAEHKPHWSSEVVRRISVGDLKRFDGVPETGVTARVFDQPKRVLLNHTNSHIKKLIGLLDGSHANLAAHFLTREILFADGQRPPLRKREQILVHDLTRRFGKTRAGIPDLDQLLRSINEDLEPF